MTPKSNELKNELNSTNQRITELEAQLDMQTAAFEATQTAFVAGKASIDGLHTEQSKLTLITQAVESLHKTASELQKAFDEATAAETLQNTKDVAKETALEAERLFNESLTIREEINTLLAQYAEKFQTKYGAFLARKKEYRNLTAQFDGSVDISADVRSLVESRAGEEHFPRLQYASAFGTALGILDHDRRRAEYAEIAKNRAA